jgi:hypothetical protein
LSTILIISCIIPICSLHAQYEIGAWVVGSGGGESSNNSHMVISALGQPLTGIKQNNSFLVQSGFMYVASASIITSVEQRDDYISTKFNLEQNFPNPFNPSTTIGFSIPERTSVSLDLYNTLGQSGVPPKNRTRFQGSMICLCVTGYTRCSNSYGVM